MAAAIALLGVLVAARLVYDRTSQRAYPGVPLPRPLRQFPRSAPGGEYSVQELELTPEVRRVAATTDSLNRSYERRGRKFWFYLGYYDGSTLESFHHPEICFPGQGLEVTAREEWEVPSSWRTPLRFNLIDFKRFDGAEVLAAYSFLYAGGYEPDWKRIRERRVFGERHYAILTTSTSMDPAGREAARRALGEFLADLVPKVEEYIHPLPREDGRGG